ncbi:MAG: N-acetyltransferase family protein [Syntrophobacteraceae bacterium]
MKEFILDEMKAEDWPRVRQIYLDGLATGMASFETDAPAWDEWDKSHLAHSRLVIRHGEEVAAWAALSPVSRRSCYSGVAEVSLYVAAAYRGRGLGKMLFQGLIESSERNGVWSLFASIFPENAASIHLHLSCGFTIIGRRERIARRDGKWRDTVIAERRSGVVGVD